VFRNGAKHFPDGTSIESLPRVTGAASICEVEKERMLVREALYLIGWVSLLIILPFYAQFLFPARSPIADGRRPGGNESGRHASEKGVGEPQKCMPQA
jgi:hypothetical protein